MDNWPAKVLSICAAIVLVLFNNQRSEVERFITVPLDLVIDDNLIADSKFNQTARITLKGQSENVSYLSEDKIYVYADFGQYKNEGKNYEAVVKYRIQDSLFDLKDIEISIEPALIKIDLEEKTVKVVPIEAVVTGFAKSGFDLLEISTDPDQVEIIGPKSAIENINVIKTANIDITDFENDFNFRIPIINKNDNILVKDEKIVDVSGKIGPINRAETFENLEIIPVQLADTLYIAGTIPGASVKIRSTQNRIEELLDSDFSFLINCSSIIRPGKYSLKVVPVIPSDLEVLSYSPQDISIEVKRVIPESLLGRN